MHAREQSYEILAYENIIFQLLANHTKISRYTVLVGTNSHGKMINKS